MIHKLIMLHGRAYGWAPETVGLEKQMLNMLSRHAGAETRLKLRLLVNHLDLEQQKEVVDTFRW